MGAPWRQQSYHVINLDQYSDDSGESASAEATDDEEPTVSNGTFHTNEEEANTHPKTSKLSSVSPIDIIMSTSEGDSDQDSSDNRSTATEGWSSAEVASALTLFEVDQLLKWRHIATAENLRDDNLHFAASED